MPKKKPKITTLRKKLWTNYFSRYIRLRDAIKTTGKVDYARCCTCNKVKEIKSMHAGHFIAQGKSNFLRFNEQNVHAQCSQCNTYGRGEQDLYSQFIEREYGIEVLKKLRQDRWKTHKFTHSELEGLIETYKTKLKELIDEHGSPWQ